MPKVTVNLTKDNKTRLRLLSLREKMTPDMVVNALLDQVDMTPKFDDEVEMDGSEGPFEFDLSVKNTLRGMIDSNERRDAS